MMAQTTQPIEPAATHGHLPYIVAQATPQEPPTSIGERIADRILTEVPSLAAKTDPARLADAMNNAVAEAADRAINEQIAKQHPQLKPILKPTSQCVYCAEPSIAVHTGQLGNRYGLCAACQRSQDKPLAFDAAFEEFAEAAGRVLDVIERDRQARA